MCAYIHSHIHSLITSLTVCTWSLNSMAPKGENPGYQAPFRGFKVTTEERMESEGTCSESHFERRSLHHNLTVTMLCLRGSLFSRLGYA